jgi:hypothetical protein
MKKQPKCYCLSNSPVNQPPPGYLTGPLWRQLPLSRAFIYISHMFPSKQGLLTKQKPQLFLKVPEKECPIHVPLKGLLWRQLLRFHSQYIIHSFTVSEQLYGGFSTSQDRIYGNVFCMCIDVGYIGTCENKSAQ